MMATPHKFIPQSMPLSEQRLRALHQDLLNLQTMLLGMITLVEVEICRQADARNGEGGEHGQ